jgi:predicted nucleic acid-binding protein
VQNSFSPTNIAGASGDARHRTVGRASKANSKPYVQFAFEDLLIGATALHLGYEVVTLNLHDFQRIPGLSVIQL